MKRSKKINLDQIIEEEKRLSVPDRVVLLAAKGLTIRQIAIEIGISKHLLRNKYAKQIEEGRVRAGALAHKTAYRKAVSGDHEWLSELMWRANHERLDPVPKIVKEAIRAEKARSRTAGYRSLQSRERQRDASGRFKSSNMESELKSEFESQSESDSEPEF